MPEIVPSSSWEKFYEITRTSPPWPRLQRAVALVEHKGDALDLGAGAGRDTVYLLQEGFHVTAVDRERSSIAILEALPQQNLKLVQSAFVDFPFETYDIINAQYALPFNPPETFNQLWAKIKQALRPRGIFTGQFFGIHDEWNKPDVPMTFHSKEQVEELLSDLEIVELREEDSDGTTADKTPKHWHVFHIIARKP
jgi:SAM-dependent methyltransferase